MMSGETPLGEQRSGDLVERVKPLAKTGFDWLTIKPMWKAYSSAGGVVALLVGMLLWVAWAFVIGVPAAVVGAILAAIGVVGSAGMVTQLGVYAAVVPTAYGGYRAYRLSQDRQTVLELFQNPTVQNGAAGFDYLDDDDAFVRANGAGAIARAMSEHDPGKVIKQAGVDRDEAARRLADLLHDDDEDVRTAGSEALAYLSRDFSEAVMQYRDDVFAATSYSTSLVQGNAAVIAGNMATTDPSLADVAVEQVEPLCDDPDPDVRGMVATALGLIPNERAGELLVALAEDTNADVRGRASEMLDQRRGGGSADAEVDVSQETSK